MSEPKIGAEYAEQRNEVISDWCLPEKEYQMILKDELERAFEAGRLSMALQLLEKRR